MNVIRKEDICTLTKGKKLNSQTFNNQDRNTFGMQVFIQDHHAPSQPIDMANTRNSPEKPNSVFGVYAEIENQANDVDLVEIFQSAHC